MICLLDTHVLLWWLGAPKRVMGDARAVLQDADNRIYVSAAVAWEMAIKCNSGKLEAREVLTEFVPILFHRGLRRLSISTDHAIRAGMLPRHHNDPFDRMLIAQALNCPIVSADTVFDSYGVRRIW